MSGVTAATSTALGNRVPFTVSVTFASDWFVGTGSGRHASVDATTLRDCDGLPALGGKSLTGVLRDRAESIARAFDSSQGAGGKWSEWVSVLFGSQPAVDDRQNSAGRRRDRRSPIPGALIAPMLRIPQAERLALLKQRIGSRRLADALFRLRPGVALDKHRIAREDMLRTIEVAAGGITIEASWQVDLPGLGDDAPLPAPLMILLLGAARLTDHVGGKRRRGLGACTVKVAAGGPDGPTMGADILAGLLANFDLATAERPCLELSTRQEELAATHVDPTPATSATQTAECVPLRLTLRSPVIVDAGAQGNLVRTMDFIPGSMLLPIVSRMLTGRAGQLIGTGQLRITDATVELDGRRALPMPRSVQVEKGAALAGATASVLTCPGVDSKPRFKSIAGYFAPTTDASGGNVMLVGRPGLVQRMHAVITDEVQRPGLVERMHAVTTDEVQRPTEKEAGLYTYQAIAAGTMLCAEVWLPADDAEVLRAGLRDGRAERIGRSRKDEYGSVDIQLADDAGNGAQTRHPAAIIDGEPAGARDLLVYLASDLLLTDASGNPLTTPGDVAAALGCRLAMTVSVGVASPLPAASATDDAAQAGTSTPNAMVSVRRRESWHTRWGLPRPSLVGMAAGSVIRLHAERDVAADALRRIEKEGLGLRVAEGFGEVCINPPWLAQPEILLRTVDPTDDSPSGTGGTSGIATGAANAGLVGDAVVGRYWQLWVAEIERAAHLRASRLLRTYIPEKATRSQVGTLRQLFSDSSDDAALRDRVATWAVRTYVEHTSAGQGDNRWDCWSKQLENLWTLAQSKDAIFRRLQISAEDVPAKLRDEMRRHAIATLIRSLARRHTRAGEGI